MIFEPENEAGVIVCFAQKITTVDNVSFVSIRTEYPDAILLINDQKYLVEFEYLSSNFVVHKHDPRMCDLIICWIDDIDHKNKLPVWELSTQITFEQPPVNIVIREAWYWELRARTAEKTVKEISQKPMFATNDLPITNPTTKKEKIKDRHKAIVKMQTDEPHLTRSDMAKRLNEFGYQVSLSTVKRDISILNGRRNPDSSIINS